MVVQGDVFFTRSQDIPKGAKRVSKQPKGYVIAEGEATGHAHVIEEDDIDLYEKDNVLYIYTSRKVEVKHEEHLPVILTEGIWQVGRVREYDPFIEEIRLVLD